VIVCVRHGETEWSRAGKHTGRIDLELTATGREQALLAGRRLAGHDWALILTSPLSRAQETARLAGLEAEPDDDLMEWDYGSAEGRTTAELREEIPDWDIWRDGPPGGETVDQIGARADRVVERIASVEGDVAVFAHGHLLRVLGARWIGLPAVAGGSFKLDTSAICELGWERERRAISLWNGRGHLRPGRV
jgi:broad specificity phosphatase PhoE